MLHPLVLRGSRIPLTGSRVRIVAHASLPPHDGWLLRGALPPAPLARTLPKFRWRQPYAPFSPAHRDNAVTATCVHAP
jgi:hypothetical protein